MTLLNRIGNKSIIAKDVQAYFPVHNQYIELFFGAGGMFFNKPKAKYNIVNDIDSDVYNLFNVVQHNRHDLVDCIKRMPIHVDLWNHWKKNTESDPLLRAVRFLFLSNYGYMGKPGTMYVSPLACNTSKALIDLIEPTFDYLFNVVFTNSDFRDFFRLLSIKDKDNEKTFVYADPPYLDTTNNYGSKLLSVSRWTEDDSFDLYNILENCGYKFAMSELNHPFIISEAKRRGLNIIPIRQRQNLKNKRTEMLVTNFKIQLTLF